MCLNQQWVSSCDRHHTHIKQPGVPLFTDRENVSLLVSEKDSKPKIKPLNIMFRRPTAE